MRHSVQSIPKGYHSVTPSLVVNDGARAIDFYKRAFGAQEKSRLDGPDGKVVHAELKIGDSLIMLSDELPESSTRSPRTLRGSSVGIFLYVDNVDDVFRQAVSAGATAEAQPSDMFWGDRFGALTDPFGHHWSLATHKEDVSREEMAKRGKEFMSKMAHQAQPA